MWLYILPNIAGGMVTTSAPTEKQSATSFTFLRDAARTCVLDRCSLYSFAMSLTRPKPSNELSSTLPTNGEIYVAPAFDASIACATENIVLRLL